jgi:hypothetical protein
MNSIAFARKNMLEQQIKELKYEGNIGLMEISKFYLAAKKKGHLSKIHHVESLIKDNKTQEAWKIILDYIGETLEKIK